MAIVPWLPGATYQSKGMIFVVLSIDKNEVPGDLVARCLVLDDHPRYQNRIVPGTIVDVGNWSTMWEEAILFASPEEQGKVSS